MWWSFSKIWGRAVGIFFIIRHLSPYPHCVVHTHQFSFYKKHIIRHLLRPLSSHGCRLFWHIDSHSLYQLFKRLVLFILWCWILLGGNEGFGLLVVVNYFNRLVFLLWFFNLHVLIWWLWFNFCEYWMNFELIWPPWIDFCTFVAWEFLDVAQTITHFRVSLM